MRASFSFGRASIPQLLQGPTGIFFVALPQTPLQFLWFWQHGTIDDMNAARAYKNINNVYDFIPDVFNTFRVNNSGLTLELVILVGIRRSGMLRGRNLS